MINSRRLLGGIVLLAVVIRVAAMVHFQTYEISPARDHWDFGFEAGRLARSLATGHGYSSPFPEPTGPSAFLAPAFPLLLAGIFRIFGVYTAASAVAVYVLNTLFSALTCFVIFRLGARIFSEGAGLLAALLFAVYPPSIWFAAATVWDTTLVTCAFAVLVLYLLDLPSVPTRAQWIAAGLLMGLIVLINPAPAVCYPFLLGWLWWRKTNRSWEGVLAAGTVTLSCALICLPWMLRNFIVVGEFGPRSTSALNFSLGNNESAWRARNGGQANELYPTNSPEEGKRFAELGEAGYDCYCARVATDFVRHNKQKFAELTLYRVRAWWFGVSSGWSGNLKIGISLSSVKQLIPILLFPLFLGGWIARRRAKDADFLLALILIYPLPYYFFFSAERYRFPIDTFQVLFAAVALTELWRLTTRRTAFSAVSPGMEEMAGPGKMREK